MYQTTWPIQFGQYIFMSPLHHCQFLNCHLCSVSCRLHSGFWSESIQYNPGVPEECLEVAEETSPSGKLPLRCYYARGRSFNSISRSSVPINPRSWVMPVAGRPQLPVQLESILGALCNKFITEEFSVSKHHQILWPNIIKTVVEHLLWVRHFAL